MHPNSLANLRPIDPTLKPDKPRLGKPGIKAQLRKLLESGITGENTTYGEKLLLELVSKAVGGTQDKPASEMAQLKAITEVLNRVHGKPVETVKSTGTLTLDGNVTSLTDEQLATIAAQGLSVTPKMEE